MQISGSLRKRKKRNLAKVNGLTTVPYDENFDSFTGSNLYSEERQNASSFAFSNEYETRLRFSAESMLEHRRQAGETGISSKTRVTRDPNYHDFEGDPNDATGLMMETNGSGNSRSRIIGSKRALPEHLKNRSHLLDEVAMRRLKQILLLGATSGTFPWKWNPVEQTIDRWSPRMEQLWWIQWAFFTLQMIYLSIFQVYALYNSISPGQKSYRAAFQSSLSLLWYLWAFAFDMNLFFYKEPMRRYVNAMLAFNREYVQKYLIHLDDYEMSGRLVINVVTLTNMSQVLVVMSLFLRMPNMPWFLFSYIYPKPWYWLIPGAIQEYVITGQIISSYILLFWVMIAHTNTLQFWLQEIHNNNDSDYTTDELRNPKTGVETYKALLVLNQVFNECMSPLAWPTLKFHLVGGLVPCGFILIRSMNHLFWDEFPGILFYPVGVWDTATAGFVVLNMSSTVFDLGCSFIDSWSRTRHKDFRRILMSCPTIKIWVGRFYFVTVATTLTFFKTVFDQVTNLIITFP